MFPLPLKLILSLTALSLLLVAAAFAPNRGPADPALTRSTSELPPPEHLFYAGVAQAAPRSIPWNCADWQESPAVADADDARVSMILESLADPRIPRRQPRQSHLLRHRPVRHLDQSRNLGGRPRPQRTR